MTRTTMQTVGGERWAANRRPYLDNLKVAHDSPAFSVLWFVGVLLLFSLAYAGWVWARQGHAGRRWRGEVHASHLLVLAAAVTIATSRVVIGASFFIVSGGLCSVEGQSGVRVGGDPHRRLGE